MESRKVALYGQSMLLSLVAASLSQNDTIKIVETTDWKKMDTLPEDRRPDVLICDLSGECESPILPLLFRNPNMLLIGLDVETNRAMLVSGKETFSLTLKQVEDIVSTY